MAAAFPDPSQPCTAVVNFDTIERFGSLRRLHLVDLLGLGRIIIPPQPSECFGKLGTAMGSVMRSVPEAEMNIVIPIFERIGQLDVL